MSRTRSFTLIELLVVMAIIAILSALLLSVISRVKTSAQAITCRNNLKQWGIATQLYAAANDDYLPPDGTSTPNDNATNIGWYIQLPQQLGLPRYADMPWRTNPRAPLGHSIWICPANSHRCNTSKNTNNLFHYCLNKNVNGTGESNQIRLVSIPHPSVTVWLFDNGKVGAVEQWNNVHSNLHNQGAQFVFLDGHVVRFNNKAYWNFKTHEGITNNPQLVWIP